jgi:hypothetical protein
LSLPCLRLCMARFTLDCAFFPYLAMGFTLWCSKIGRGAGVLVRSDTSLMQDEASG